MTTTSSDRRMRPGSRIGVFTERQVGIGSAAAALEPYLRVLPNVTWTDVTYYEANGLLERTALLKPLRGTLRGFLQTGAGLRHGPYSALLFLTHNPAVLHQHAVGQTPTLLWTDVTPALLDAQADRYEHRVDRVKLVGELKRAAVRRTFHRAAVCAGWSDWARRSFVTDYGVPEHKTRVVPPGVDLARWTPSRREPPRAAPARILFVGGDFVRKGGDLLLEVYRAHLRGRCELDIVTRDEVPEAPGVRVHHGLTPGSAALRALYENASAFALPTRGDCFSIASLEAMATGLPVVVAAVGGIGEIIEHGASGFAIAPDDGEQLRASLDAILTDPQRARAMGARGRAIVEERFDAEKTAGALLNLLEELGRGPAR